MDATNEIKEAVTAQLLHAEPGDVVWVKFPKRISMHEAKRSLQDLAGRLFNRDVLIMASDDDIDVRVMPRQELQELVERLTKRLKEIDDKPE